MDVYVFSSASIENIQIGLDKKLWAVGPIDEVVRQARVTRALDMPVGAAGLFYSSQRQIFTSPFRVESKPVDESVEGVWPERWHLPFSILPIGNLSTFIPINVAKGTWPLLEGIGNVTEVVNLGPVTAFSKTWFPRRNWDIILEQLKIDIDEFEDLFS